MVLSSTEVEYVGATHATQEALWLRQMLLDLGIHQPDLTRIWCNNWSSIALSTNPSSYACTKHIAIQHHFMCDTITCGLICLSWIPMEKQVADILTKDLGRMKHECFCMSMGLVSWLRGGVEHEWLTWVTTSQLCHTWIAVQIIVNIEVPPQKDGIIRCPDFSLSHLPKLTLVDWLRLAFSPNV